MAYKKVSKKFAVRESSLDATIPAPGIHPEESVVELDNGEQVAVSVRREWMENGAGIAFHASARWIEADGTTKMAPNGAQIISKHTHLPSMVTLNAHGADAIATELALLVIGEDPKLHIDSEDQNKKKIKVPVLDIHEEARLNSSIRHQIKAVKATKEHRIDL
jgi:hypothetical protein